MWRESAYAMGIDTAIPVAQQLIDIGRVQWPWLGVILNKLNAELAMQVGVPIREGVLIADMFTDGPAWQAGARSGDVIVSMGWKPVIHRARPDQSAPVRPRGGRESGAEGLSGGPGGHPGGETQPVGSMGYADSRSSSLPAPPLHPPPSGSRNERRPRAPRQPTPPTGSPAGCSRRTLSLSWPPSPGHGSRC